jgi:hypothetical protein
MMRYVLAEREQMSSILATGVFAPKAWTTPKEFEYRKHLFAGGDWRYSIALFYAN